MNAKPFDSLFVLFSLYLIYSRFVLAVLFFFFLEEWTSYPQSAPGIMPLVTFATRD